MKRNLFIIGAVIAALLAIIIIANIQSPDEYYGSVESFMADADTITLSINCATINNNLNKLDKSLSDSGIVPKDGIIRADYVVLFKEGDSVFDVLERFTKQNRMQFAYTGEYVESIYNIHEFSCGPLSGWMFKVNGEFSDVSAKAHKLQVGDKVEWVYSCDLGRDVGNIYGGDN